jgi:peptide subunit release factor 1 (eRF1)
MKFLSREQVEDLSKFKSEDFLTTSFYLNSDKSQMRKKEIALSLKNLLNQSKSQVEQMDAGKKKKDSLYEDLNKIGRFCSQNLSSDNFSGLAIFSCSSKDFWQFLNLPSPPRNRIVFDRNPYVRPLSAILDEHHRIFALTLDRKEAKWYDIFMGEISLLDSHREEVPSKVKEGGWEGYESKRIERHIATHVHDNLKKIAQNTFKLFKQNHFDWIFLGCREKHGSDFEALLHPYIKGKIKGRLKATPNDSQATLLKESLELEKKLKKQEEAEIVPRLISELEKGGLATSGLKQTLRSLNQSEVQTLVVTRHFAQPGRKCPQCHFLFVDKLKCPSCQRKTDKMLDIIDEAVEAAMDKNCQVKHITPPSKLSRYGKIGAFLRYKT